MTDSERIKLLEETVLLMSKCLDVQRFLKLSESNQDLLMANIVHITADIKQPSGWEYCSHCNKVLEPQDKFCWNCGAELIRENDNENSN